MGFKGADLHAPGRLASHPSILLKLYINGRNGEDGTETMLELCEAVQRNVAAFSAF